MRYSKYLSRAAPNGTPMGLGGRPGVLRRERKKALCDGPARPRPEPDEGEDGSAGTCDPEQATFGSAAMGSARIKLSSVQGGAPATTGLRGQEAGTVTGGALSPGEGGRLARGLQGAAGW